ncbi:zf-TFIIB domain-containing protein [Streptomyces sp. NPDC058773]|uniref:TFIIB-type zinc ribbon-containing protein n=1 Tax=Streptomyces sp. NPDC058773 TaxID=3346632 RepID=UPI0036D0ED7E
MQTYRRHGVQLEQRAGCQGIFLDHGELKALTRLASQWAGSPRRHQLPGLSDGSRLGRSTARPPQPSRPPWAPRSSPRLRPHALPLLKNDRGPERIAPALGIRRGRYWD